MMKATPRNASTCPHSHHGRHGRNARLATLAPRCRQRGQGTVEYAVIGVALGVALFAPIPGMTQTVGQLLASSVHNLYDSVSFFLSLP
jgi:hypothetical protein